MLRVIEENITDARVHWAAPPDLKVSEWADTYRQLSSESSSEPGQWRTDRAEYQRGILDALNDPLIETIVVMSSAQVGKTEVINNIVGYYIHQDPSPILCLQPTLEMAKTWSKDRLAPMVRDTPVLTGKLKDPRSRDGDNTLFHKRFPGGHITMSGANSPASLASRPIRVCLLDEVDRFPVSAGSEGDPVNLARKRTTTFWNRKIVLTSTPTVKGASRIESAYEMSDKRRYFVPCPHCGTYQVLKWGGKDEAFGIKWDDGPVNVGYLCESCGALIRDREKLRMILSGGWRSTGGSGKVAGFHLNELCSPWVSWETVVSDFLEAKKSPETLQVWINTALGETYEEQGEKLEAHKLHERQEEYSLDDMPEGVLVITAGVDIQKDRIEMELVGWGIGEESWSLDYVILHGDPTKAEIWGQLDDTRSKYFKHPLYGNLPVSMVFIDSSYETDNVYAYVKRRRGVMAIQGQSSYNGKPKPLVPEDYRTKRSKKKRQPYVPVGVDVAKDVVYARLRFAKPGPGYCHFPDTYPPTYFTQLTAEEKRTKWLQNRPVKYWYLTKGKRNEALDCRVYAFAALRFLRVNFEKIKERYEKRAKIKKDVPEVEEVEMFTDGVKLLPLKRGRQSMRPKHQGFINRY